MLIFKIPRYLTLQAHFILLKHVLYIICGNVKPLDYIILRFLSLQTDDTRVDSSLSKLRACLSPRIN